MLTVVFVVVAFFVQLVSTACVVPHSVPDSPMMLTAVNVCVGALWMRDCDCMVC